MNKQDLKRFKTLLENKRDEIAAIAENAKDSTKPVELDQASVGRLSRMDAMQSQAMAQESMRRREKQIVQINAALGRISQGEYGVCELCEEDIDIRRLEFDPSMRFCVDCASKKE